MTTNALGEGTKLNAWHLQMFGVLPEHQNEGVGGALLRHVEAIVCQFTTIFWNLI
jgi:ribosomal protein S18 acetylase RimI-like enzyme